MADSSIFSDSDPTRRLFGDGRLFPERTPVFGWNATAPGMNDPRPDPVSQMRAARVSTALVDGTVLSSDELAADKYGARLMAIRSRTSKFGFKDALFSGSFWDFVPFMGMLATAAGDLSAARDASNAFQKMLRGEQVTRDEAIRATLWKEEQEMRAEGTWGAMFGSIVRQAPAFAAEMGALNLIGGVARTAAARGALGAADSAVRVGNLTDDLVDSVLRLNVTRGVKRASMFEYGPMFVRDAVAAEQQAGAHATAAVAARVLRDDPVAVAKLTEQVANGVTSVLQKSSPELTRYGSWAPLLQERVASRLAERAVRADLAYMSRDSRWARWFDATRRAMADSFVEGLIDLGAWGSESATTLTTTHSRASRAFAQAALDFTVYPTARGAALFAPREAVSFAGGQLVSAVTGRDPVRENALSMQYEAWRQNNPDLMDSAETYGLVLDLLEYVSENSGRGFSNFMRGAGLSVAPNLIRPARKVAGLVEKTGATQIVRDTAGKITDIVAPVGLVDAASSAEVGGVISRYVGKVFGGRSLREGLAQRRFNAVVGKLEKAGMRVNDRAALQATVTSGVVDRALDPQIARAIGSDVKGFVDSALKESDAIRLFGMKTHALFMFHAMDFMAKHNFDAQRAYEAFKSLGYDGIASEMFEERYIDVVKELFGIDAQQKGFPERLATAIQRLVWPEGGLKQLLAEAAGFAVPAVARAGVARTIAAMGSPNDYAKHNMWSAAIGDLVKYGSVGTYHKGDYIAKTDEQIQRLREAARAQREQASAGEVDGVPLTEARKADLAASADRYEEGALRAERLRRSFLASLGDARGEAFEAPIYADSRLVSGDFEFERHMQITAEQARQAMASYREAIAFSANMGQLQYKARHKTPEESAGWFRKAAHWATEHAVRAAGFAATGDLAFLTANPAAFAAEDKGVDRHLLDLLHDGYAQDYDAAIRRLREGSADGVVNTDSAHEMALESFRPKAEGLVAGYLASMQTLAFSRGELADIALAKVAEDDGFIVDAKGRRLVRRAPVDAARPQELEGIGYDEFLARPGVQARVDAEVDGLARVAYDALTSAASERASASVLAGALDRSSEAMMLRAIARIPAGLPTAQQALMAAVLKYSPAFAGSGDARMRNIMVEKQVDPSRPLADQLTGISNYKDVLDTVASLAFGDRRLETQDDVEAAISEGIGRVDPGVMETIGRVLGYEHDFTEKGVQERDAKILRYALQTTAFDDPDRAVYSRPAPVAEEDQRFGSVDDETVTVVHSGGKWSGQFLRVSTNARVPVSTNTLEELDRMLADDDFGYARRRRRIIHTPVRVIYGDSALDFIRALNLGREYRERQEAVYQQTGDQALLDPLLRKNADGGWLYTPEEAEEARRQEAARAADFAAHGRQGPGLASGASPVDVTHWLRQGESAEDNAAVLRARQRMTEARQAWLNRERRQEQDGRALGYNAIAEDLVSGYGVKGAGNSAFENKFAVVDAGARGRFSMALSAYSRRLGGDIYVSIDHGTAQSYSASLLRGAVNEALSRSFKYVNRMFGPYIKGFLVEAEKVIDKRIADAKDDLERAQWQEFRSATVGGVGDGSRKASLATISSFIEAFCLYRTEVPERELYSALGDFYAQLKAIAPDMRKSGAYLPFCAMADYVLGGRGFSMLGLEPDADPLANGRRGLAFFYKLFAPATSSLRAAISDTLPVGQSEDQKQQAVRDFVASLQEKAQAAFRPRVSTPGAKRTSSRGPAPSPSPAPTPAPAPASAPTASAAAESIVKPLDVAPTAAAPSIAVPSVVEEMTKSLLSRLDGLATMDAAQAVLDAEARKNGRPPTEEEAAVFAASLAGDTAEVYPGVAGNPVEQPEGAVPEEEEGLSAVSEDGEQYADMDDEEDSVDGGRYDDDPRGFASVEPESPSRVLDDNGKPVQRPEASNLPGLAEDEAKVFSSVVARVLSFSGADVDVGLVRAFLRRVAPVMSQAEIDQVAAAYEATGGRFVGDADWVFDAQKDEEGITPDGYDFNDTHNVEVIKSDLVRRLLAILSRVSPATGRDFQPFVEDLRSFADGVERILVPAGVADAKVEEASRWLWKLLNPRANGNFDSAVGRDAAYSELLDMMDPPPRGSQTLPAKWMQVQSYVQAFIGKAGTPAPCARAALFVSYLMGLPSNVREQLTRFISSSAPAQPVETSTHYDAKGNVYFITHAARFRPGSASREAMASALAIFADRPPAELLAAADGLEKAFRDEAAKAKAEHRLDQLVGAFKKGADRVVSLPDGSGLFDVYARLLAPVLGGDNPLVVAFMSRRFANLVRSTRPDRRLSSSALANLARFAYRGDDGALPFAVQDLVSLMRVAAKASKGPRVDRQTLLDATRGTFQSSAPAARALHFAPSSVMGRGPWASLITEYSRAKPVSVMRAKNDETRTRQPASSLAITMPGVEPVLQQFLDRKDDRGAEAFCREFFPDAVKDPDFDMGLLRQRMEWPDGTGIVAHQIVKTAYANEVREGNKFTYENKDSDMLYVAAFAGDHTSGFIFQAPVAKQLRDRGITYEQAEKWVADLLGVDLFGVDAKRSMLSSLEAPGFSLVGLKHDSSGGAVVDAEGRPQLGRLRYGILWHPEGGADANEALKGSLGMYGYGARRARKMARDPSLAVCKLHVASVGTEPNGITMPEITKSLVTAHFEGTAERYGQFVDGPMRTVMEYAEKLAGNDPADTAIVTDADSPKMSLVNSKMLGVVVAGKQLAIKDFVLDVALKGYLDSGKELAKGASISGAELDAVLSAATGQVPGEGQEGLVPVKNLAKGGEVSWVRLSEFVPGLAVTCVQDGIYALEYDAANLMGFQVANVAHKAKASAKSVARNHLMDMGSVGRVLETHNADADSGLNILPGLATTTSLVGDVVANYGFLATAITTDEKSIGLTLERNEDWQRLRRLGLPTTGPQADEIRRQAYSTWVNSIRTPAMRKIPAALVSSGAWIDRVTGEVKCTGASQMYLDMQQGERTIGRADRAFWRAHKRVALAGVNSTDVSFRHGLFVDEKGLLSDPELAWAVPAEGTDAQRVVVALENIIGGIVSGCAGWSATDGQAATPEGDAELERYYRHKLGQYLRDHTGKALSERTFESKDKKTGETVLRSYSQTVKYLDLFTRMTADAEGNFAFDRSAVYEGIHDQNGEAHLYLGGTKFAFTRTPSYNLHVEVVRAGLPATTVPTEDGGWMCGTDAIVMADPFSLKMLGNDNDGDKTDLYMLDQGDGHLMQGDDEGLFCYDKGNIDGIFRRDLLGLAEEALIKHGDPESARRYLVEWRRWLVSEGILVRERVRSGEPGGRPVEGKLVLSPLAKRRLSNTLVLGWFDMNSAIPVPSDAANVPRYTGTVSDGTRRGSMSVGVKASTSVPMYKEGEPDDKYPEHTRIRENSVDYVLDAAAPKLLDLKDPAKRIDNGATAAAVETSAHLVADCRARFVATARNLNVLWAARAPEGLALLFEDARDFVDSVLHLDGPSNMSFDDMKEQVCSRLGLWPGMADTFIAEYFVLNGGLPVTDALANKAMRSYAEKVNRGGSLYNYMLRASNPSDFQYRRERLREGRTLEGLYALFQQAAEIRGLAKPKLRDAAADRWIGRLTRWMEYSELAKPPSDAVVGAYDCLRFCGESEMLDVAVEFSKWADATSAIARGSQLARAINYSYADPGDPGAYSTYRTNMTDVRSMQAHDSFDSVPAEDAPALVEPGTPMAAMFTATQLLLRGDGRFSAYNRGLESADTFKGTFAAALREVPPVRGGSPSAEGMFLAAASVAPRVAPKRTITLANNARTVGRAAATFLAVPSVKGSVFNDSADGRLQTYRKCAMLAEAVAFARHAPKQRRGEVRITTNATADFLWAVETMVDVLSRFVSLSHAHRVAPIADLLREEPAGTGYGFDEADYGPAVEGAARISLALPDMSDEQLKDLQGMMRKLVDERVLDRDGVEGSKAFRPTNKGMPLAGGDVFYEFSAENMRRMLKTSEAQTGTFAQKKVSKEGAAAGTQRDLQEGLRILIGVFEYLSKEHPEDFPAGFSVQPSALFGQLLPIYAALTDVPLGVPGPGTRALSSSLLDYMAPAEFLVGQMNGSPAASRYLRLAEALDYGLVPGYSQKEDFKLLRAVPTRSELAQRTRKAVLGGLPKDGLGSVVSQVAKPANLSGFYPKAVATQPRPTLGVFDGPRGVAFEALVNIMASYRDNPYAGLDESELAPVPTKVEVSVERPEEQDTSLVGQLRRQQAGAFDIGLSLRNQFAGLPVAGGGRRNASVAPAPVQPSVKWRLTPVRANTARATKKDQDKFNKLGGITKFIGFGSEGTSTQHYADTTFREIANTGSYATSDIVGVSVNGDTKNRVPLKDPRVQAELLKAVEVGATIIGDEKSYREASSYNVGEKELASWLAGHGYVEDAGSGVWRPGGVSPETDVSPDTVKEVGRRVAQVFKLWSGARAQYNPNDNTVEIFSDLVVNEGDPNARALKTCVKVHVTNGGLNLGNREAVLRSIAARSGVSYEKLASDSALAEEMIKKYPVAGVTTFRFDDAPGSFRVAASDLEMLVADVSLDARKVALHHGTEFHEAFHAALGFARAVGVLTDADIDVLASKEKYGSATYAGQKWFDEEQAAVEYQALLNGKFRGLSATEATSEGIFQKFYEFIKMLVDALRNIVADHRSEDYANPIASNPLTGLVLTGHIAASKGEGKPVPKTMDRQTRLYEALRNESVQEGGVMQGAAEDFLQMDAGYLDVALELMNAVKRLAGVDRFPDDASAWAALRAHGQAAYGEKVDWYDAYIPDLDDYIGRSPDESPLLQDAHRAVDLLRKYGPVVAVGENQGFAKGPPLNIWYATGENAELSNLAARPFEFDGHKYVSVEHAYQTLKSGAFDVATYRKPWTAGSKFRGKPVDTSSNLELMQRLVMESFAQNPAATEKLLSTGDRRFTHVQDQGVWATEFPRILEEVRRVLRAATQTGALDSTDPAPQQVIPNPEFNPDFVQPPEGARQEASAQDLGVNFSFADRFASLPVISADEAARGGFASVEPADPVLPRVRDALARAGIPMQMATPYGSADAMAALVGAILRNDATPAQREVAERIAERAARARGAERTPGAMVHAAIERVRWLYGTHPDDRSVEIAGSILQALADGKYSTNGTSLMVGGNPERTRRSHATRASLAAAVAVTSGTMPSDILEAALFDLRAIRDRRGSGNTLSDEVLGKHFIPELERLYAAAADPTELVEMFDPGREEGPSRSDPHSVFARLEAGLTEQKDLQGNRVKFKVAAAGSSDNPFHRGNVDLYHDHEGDPDFQRAAGITLDAVYMVAAARRMYMDLGFRPGTPDQELYAPGVLSPAEMAADLAAAPEQYEDPSFSAVDSGWFVAASQDDWLDSVMRPAFGSVKLRDAAQNSHRAVERFRWRATALNNLHAYEYGLSGNPGDALLAVDEEYRGDRFGWSAGGISGDRVREFSPDAEYEPGQRVRHGGKLWRAKRALGPAAWDASAFDEVYEDPVRRYDHLNRTPAKDRDGNRIRMTRADMRVVDLVLKARLAWMSGARKLVTGVDGLTFHYEMPDDASEYTREKVKARVGRGAAGGETDLDKALNRIDIQLRDSYGAEQFDWITESGAGRYGLRQSLVEAACAALKRAKRLVDTNQMPRTRVNDYVISALSQAGLVSGVQKYSKEFGGPVYVSAAVSLDPDRIEELFLQSATYRKLLDAGRRAEWLTRDAYLRPYVDLVREMRQFTLANPFTGRGAARFFQGVTSPMPFSGGDGITVYGLARAAEDDPAEVAQEVRTSFADAFERNIGNADGLLKAPADVVLMVRQLFHLPAGDVETVRRRLAQGDFSGVRGLEDIGAGSTVGDLVGAVQRRLDDLVFNKSFGSRDAALFGGRGVVKSLVRAYREASYDANAPVPNVAGLAPDAVHRMTGRLPANFQAGHAVVNMADGLANALAYRATLVNMVTTPDADGMPLCYAKPALDAEATTGVPDAVWGEVARWWGELHGLAYDGLKTGVENARAMYDEIVEGGHIDKDQFGSINPEDMDDRAVEGFWARKGVPEGESELSHLAGGYALGYAKHLFRSTKGLGTRWQRAMVHRAWAYSKAMSVSFSLFFPIATRLESPVGAVGMMATVGGNVSPEFVRRHAKALNGIFGALGSPAWITRGFTGEADFAKMLDSNDPFLAEMYDFASAIGLTMSTADANPEENARGILQGDLRNLVAFVRAKFGDSAAKKVADISGALLTHASEKAFTYHLNATKLAVAAQLCMKLRADAAKEGIAFDPVRDMRRYASYVNAEIGGIDPLQYAWAHPGMQNFLNSLFFSWQWTRGAWEAGGGKVIEQVLFGGHDTTPEERKFLIGRAIRMYGWIAFGIPTVAQFMIKAIAMAIDPNHEDRDEEKWWIWENEDKANMKAFNLTPLMRAVAKRFPRYAEWRGEHRTLAALPTAAFMLTKSPWLSLAALPVYTGMDPRNTTGLRPYYMHFGKQVWEFNRWFESPWQQFASKLAMPVQRLTEGVLGRSLTWMDHPLPWYRKGDVERWIAPTWDSAIVNLGKAFLPFSFAGLSDLGDAGLLPTLGPVSMGTSGQETLKELKADLEAWVSNDRAWYRRPRAAKRASSAAQAMRRFRARTGENPVVWRHVANLLANGYSEMQARSMVDRAIGDLRSERYRKLEAMLPKRPDGDYDVKEWSKTVRELQKLGLTAKGAYDALLNRLQSSTVWKERASAELREKYFEMVKQAATPPQGERTY